VLGVLVAVAAMGAATLAVRWPAPGVAALLGFAVYLLARGRGEGGASPPRGG
jgi:hypothetical protein